MDCTNEDLRRYIEMFFEDESHHHEDLHELEHSKAQALKAFDALAKDQADLLARIRDLESRAAKSAALVVQAIDLMQAPKKR
ncbi:hypothetical protein [Caballeronia sp. DA-9]|uniref:hypothetical protein n=1 Tax=Caballeronia sp. DA-9 TaxID=3436237 RepID=UPI003F67A09B